MVCVTLDLWVVCCHLKAQLAPTLRSDRGNASAFGVGGFQQQKLESRTVLGLLISIH